MLLIKYLFTYYFNIFLMIVRHKTNVFIILQFCPDTPSHRHNHHCSLRLVAHTPPTHLPEENIYKKKELCVKFTTLTSVIF